MSNFCTSTVPQHPHHNFCFTMMDLDGAQSPSKAKRSRSEMEADEVKPAKESAVKVEDGITSIASPTRNIANT